MWDECEGLNVNLESRVSGFWFAAGVGECEVVVDPRLRARRGGRRCIAGIDMSCVICGAFHESDMHALFECVMEKMIWEVTTVKGVGAWIGDGGEGLYSAYRGGGGGVTGCWWAAVFHVIELKGGDLRYCQKCSHYKPPRAHHCRVCKRCVLRMDHHCIWINNCVGHANYKIFFVFVLYAVIACLYSLVLLLGSIVSDGVKDEPQNEGSSRTIYVISCILLFPLTIALGVLLVWHIYLTLRNKTTIEYYEGVRAMWLAEKGGEVYRHPYDLGAYENLTFNALKNNFNINIRSSSDLMRLQAVSSVYDVFFSVTDMDIVRVLEPLVAFGHNYTSIYTIRGFENRPIREF
ncbi:hypothetical protein Cgig2_024206 [Carnegiea gigantea]|uniref:S-acyltransferase n=1 Tax=Carnegiea gigantea TaxID=171969 RepID=A0A9Q1GLM8_9CARY|nr:hypothetical protein Cgig2_024206 [Carnegiea gigantea]